MSTYINSQGVERGTWGLDTGNNGKVVGYDVNNRKSKTLFQRMFGLPKHNTGGLQNIVKKGKENTRRNNGGVPKFNFSPTKFFRRTGETVLPNTGETLKTRLSIFEQNFIKRLYATYQDAQFNKAPINLSKYAELLEEENDESKAILLYNELIVLYILLAIDSFESLFWSNRNTLNYYLRARGDIKAIEYLQRFSREDRFAAFIISNILVTGGLMTAMIFAAPVTMGVSAIPAGILAFFLLFGQVGGSLAAYTLNWFTVDCLFPLPNTNYWAEVGRVPSGHPSRVDVFKYINLILFSPNNAVPITEVKDKLRYWGLLQTQVDFMFKVGTEGIHGKRIVDMDSDMMSYYILKMIQYFDKARKTENFTLAPNEPFSEDLLKAAYPKPPLAGNPFPNTSTFPLPPTRPLKSMTGGLTRRRINKKYKMSKRKYRR